MTEDCIACGDGADSAEELKKVIEHEMDGCPACGGPDESQYNGYVDTGKVVTAKSKEEAKKKILEAVEIEEVYAKEKDCHRCD
jgi:hypothetical protein